MTDTQSQEIPVLSEFDRHYLHRIMAGEGDWFSAKLLRFIRDSRPDRRNLERLRSVYPDHVAAVEYWYDHRADGGPYPGYLEFRRV